MQKKHFIYLAIFFGLCVVGSYVGRYMIESDTPPFVLEKLNQLKEDKSLMDSIGGFDRFEYSFNENDFKLRDTVKFSIKITGDDKILSYNGTQLKTAAADWKTIDEKLTIEDK